VTYNTGSLAVTPAPLTVTPTNETKSYGSTFTAFAGTLTGIENGDAITGSYSSLGAAATAGVAGDPYAITATLNDPNGLLGNYTVTYNSGSLAVTPAPLTVTPANETKTYGSTFTAFAGTLAGLENGDNITASFASPGAATTASVAGGPYAITATLDDPNSLLGNYTVTYNSGSLAVTPAPLTVTPANETNTYGSTFTAFAGTLAGLQNGDNITAGYSSPGTAATASVAGGPYAITATLNDPSSLLGNYTVTYNTGSLAVTPAPLTVTPTNETKSYGSTFTAFAGTLAGLENGDNITASYASPGAAATAGVVGGPYAITATLGDPNSLLGNYTVTYNSGSLAVTPAPLTVTPANETKTYGSTFTAFAGTLAGLENGDNITASYASPGAAATAGVAGGPYAITATLNDPSGLLGNYTVTYNVGSLTVTQEVLTVNSTETTDALELSSNVQAVIGSGGNLTVNNPVELDPGGEVSIVNGGSATLPGVSLQPGAEGVNFDSGTLQAGGGFATSAPISIAAGGATIDSNGFDMSLMGSLTGPGGVTTVGAGSVALLGTNTYAGGTVVSAGTLIAGSRGALPVGSALMVGADASLLFGNQNSVSAGIAVPVAGSAGNVTVATATMTRSAGADTTRTAAFDTATKVTPAKVPMIGSVLLKTANMPAGISASAIHDAAILAAPSKNAARDMIWLDDFYGELSFASAGQNARLSEAALALEAVLAEYARS
jgi:autotransporter-associated beta strand protein